jgi:hypothetical protein
MKHDTTLKNASAAGLKVKTRIKGFASPPDLLTHFETAVASRRKTPRAAFPTVTFGSAGRVGHARAKNLPQNGGDFLVRGEFVPGVYVVRLHGRFFPGCA